MIMMHGYTESLSHYWTTDKKFNSLSEGMETTSKGLQFFDYFSGIGGGRLGLEQSGFVCIGHADTSRLSDTTYRLLFDCSDKNYGNINKINPETLPPHDIMIGGFPCQTFSVIGRREGFEDPRGLLVFRLLEISERIKPRFMIFENVRGLVSHNKGKTLQTIIDSIGGKGYYVRYKVLNSIDYGVPQMRQRVYIICFREYADYFSFQFPTPVETPLLSNYLVSHKTISKEQLDTFYYYLNNKTNNGNYTVEQILSLPDYTVIDTRMSDLRIYKEKVPTLRSHRDGLFYVFNNTLCELKGEEALLLQGFPKEYAKKVVGIVSDRHLLLQTGNSMTVSVINALGEMIGKLL
ncbi:MAG: DNA (cytosine-5-)-methyltransferase [Spirochaetales bacterium]|nr:DNA (cytosine-5-)-methyltransferase [Spirochaetales bacterium]